LAIDGARVNEEEKETAAVGGCNLLEASLERTVQRRRATRVTRIAVGGERERERAGADGDGC